MKSNRQNNSNKRHSRATRVVHFTLRSLIWVGAIILYYVLFSFFFDTPIEHRMKKENERMQAQYERIEARYDSLAMVLENVDARDKSVFRILFETDPYNFTNTSDAERVALHESSINASTEQLQTNLAARISKLEKLNGKLLKNWDEILAYGVEMGEQGNNIPAIQPVINDNLTLLTAGYGTILSPFYRTMKSHQGVDYSIGEGSSVFATADGVVKEISDKNSTLGKTIIIDHGNGYQTSYSHLLESLVRKGQQVNRGDVIALSGNSGLSLAPHLHYEVRYNDMRVNPIHFFFMELSPEEYQRIIQISQSGMQSLD